MAVILFVRIRSALDEKEIERRLQERRPRFEQVPGLLQKICGRDPACLLLQTWIPCDASSPSCGAAW